MQPTFRYVLLTALRDRLFAALVILIAAALLVSSTLSSAVVAEGDALSLAYGATACRTILVLGLVIFVSFHVRRMFDTREIEAVLSRPLSRESFVLAYFGGLAVVVLLLVVPAIAGVALLLSPNSAGLAAWGLSLLVEALVVVALALFCALSLPSAVTSALSALGFYAMARLSVFFLDIAKTGLIDEKSRAAGQATRTLTTVFSAALPRLDLLGQTNWLAYGKIDGGLTMGIASGLLYAALLVLAAMFDLRRRKF